MRKFMNATRLWGRVGGPDKDWIKPHVLWLPQQFPQVLDYFARLRENPLPVPRRDRLVPPLSHVRIGKRPCPIAGTSLARTWCSNGTTGCSWASAYPPRPSRRIPGMCPLAMWSRRAPAPVPSVREAAEELDVAVDEDSLELVHVVHLLDPEHHRPRVQLFFRVHRWHGELTNNEPDRCAELAWWPTTGLPTSRWTTPARRWRPSRRGGCTPTWDGACRLGAPVRARTSDLGRCTPAPQLAPDAPR